MKKSSYKKINFIIILQMIFSCAQDIIVKLILWCAR